jgi:hypothetical protein
MTKFYQFRQNNSGGFFCYSDDGIGKYVIIEAHDASEANKRAEQIGLYFNGVEDNIDCDCCGNRWYRTDESEGDEVPSIYGEPIENCEDESDGFIHYLDGTIKSLLGK